MPEYTDAQKDYARYRIDRSREDLEAAFTIRNASDYDNMFIASRGDTEEQIANAEYFMI